MYICKNCGKEFERACQLGGHVIQCIYHIQENIFLQSIKQYNNNPNLCFFCKGPILHVSGYLNETKNKKFCDSSCAAKFNNHKRRKEKLCFNCGKPHTRENADYCSKECVESIKAQKCWGKVERNEKIKVSIVKNYLIKERGHKCQTCGGTEGNKQPIPIEIHHINGDCLDHRRENLLLICPNCHAQTDNYKFKNKHSKRQRW